MNIQLPGGRNLERGDAAAGRTPAPALGKNLIGAFWQPVAVVADPLVLQTLPPREYRSGVAECIKHAIIADAAHFAFLEENAEAIARAEPQAVQTLIEQSARIKIGIVEQDERESGIRALLNLGHTFAHAIESMHELDVRHGEAVAIGLIAAGRCAVATGRLGERDLERIESLVKQFDLPHELPAAAPIEALMQAMSFDKKVIGGRLRLVLPTKIGAAEVTDDVPPEIVRDAWRKAGAR